MATEYLTAWQQLHLDNTVKSSVFINNSSYYNRLINELSNIYFDEYFEDRSLDKRYKFEYNIMTPSREKLVKSYEVGSWFFDFGIFTSDKRIIQDGRKCNKVNFLGFNKKGYRRNKRRIEKMQNREKVKHIICEWFKAKEVNLYNESTHDIDNIIDYMELTDFEMDLLYTFVISDTVKELADKYGMKKSTLYSKRNKLLDRVYIEMDLNDFFNDYK